MLDRDAKKIQVLLATVCFLTGQSILSEINLIQSIGTNMPGIHIIKKKKLNFPVIAEIFKLKKLKLNFKTPVVCRGTQLNVPCYSYN